MFVAMLTTGRQTRTLGLSFDSNHVCRPYRTCRGESGGYRSGVSGVKMDFNTSSSQGPSNMRN